MRTDTYSHHGMQIGIYNIENAMFLCINYYASGNATIRYTGSTQDLTHFRLKEPTLSF